MPSVNHPEWQRAICTCASRGGKLKNWAWGSCLASWRHAACPQNARPDSSPVPDHGGCLPPTGAGGALAVQVGGAMAVQGSLPERWVAWYHHRWTGTPGRPARQQAAWGGRACRL